MPLRFLSVRTPYIPLKRLDSLWLYIVLLVVLLAGYTLYLSRSSINNFLYEEVEDDAQRIATYIGAHFEGQGDPLQHGDGQHLVALDKLRKELGVFKFKYYDSAGQVVFSSDPTDVGTINTDDKFQQQVMQGQRISVLEQEEFNQDHGDVVVHDVMETYYPYMNNDQFTGALEIYFDVTAKANELAEITNRLYFNFSIGAVVMLLLVTALIRRSYQATLSDQKKHSQSLMLEIEKRTEIEQQLVNNERRFDFMAHHDELTGQANRRLYMEQLQLTVKRAQRYHRQFCLLFLDLDNFKDVNDNLGHSVGDQLLKAIVNRLNQVLRDSDFLARIGGDEFTLILEDVKDEVAAQQAAQRLLNVLTEPVQVGLIRLKVNVSIGVCLYPQDGNNAEELTQHADSAMYEAKRKCKGGSQFYNHDLSVQGARQLKIQSDLESAVSENQLVLYYQPQIDLNTGKINGAEALVRWFHPELGLISPVEFIPIAERSDCIIGIGEWVIETTCIQVMRWRQRSDISFSVAVNLSPRQFRDSQLLGRINRLMPAIAGESPPLELELTETLLMDDTQQTMTTLQACADRGIGISIDDFGTGYSSLSYLQRFPAQKLKIDRSFVSKIDDPCSAVIVETIIGLGKNLGMTLVAEGAEEEHQVDFLKQRGCDLVQGYYFSKPLPADQFEQQWLNTSQFECLDQPLVQA